MRKHTYAICILLVSKSSSLSFLSLSLVSAYSIVVGVLSSKLTIDFFLGPLLGVAREDFLTLVAV